MLDWALSCEVIDIICVSEDLVISPFTDCLRLMVGIWEAPAASFGPHFPTKILPSCTISRAPLQ